MNKPLKQAVIDQLETYALSEEQLVRLEALSSKAAPVSTRRIAVVPLTAAAAVVVFLLVFLLTPFVVEEGDVRERIAMEVAANHIKLKPLEVETGSIEDIRDYFNKLDFMPVTSTLVRNAGLELIGGRYCSLQGVTAAQLRVQKPGSQRVQTLYQTEYVKAVFKDMPVMEEGGEPVEMYVKGVRVKIWVEKGLLFALTELPDNADQ